jgi:intracellular sulfur oxidation DsrE/DsrF family protein
METTLKNKIEEFLKSLNIDNLEITDFIDIEEIDLNNPFDSIYEQIDDNGGFNIEIIYYSNAIEYLKEHDPSLDESLNLASEFGLNTLFSSNSLNSEFLASLLASQNVRNDFYEKEKEINLFFANL